MPQGMIRAVRQAPTLGNRGSLDVIQSAFPKRGDLQALPKERHPGTMGSCLVNLRALPSASGFGIPRSGISDSLRTLSEGPHTVLDHRTVRDRTIRKGVTFDSVLAK